ncbi:MAG TPA: Gfo/Idh/MocA family oxidoreductase [Dissulfurispiraceae bacterium]|nr:Gfo/Idh/MocA family oxidoreductase [Dissulfurispiraceae bacterium]
MINAGVIGVGYLGQHHARILAGLEGVRLAAVVDTDIKRAEEIAAKYGGRAFADYREAMETVDSFSIVAPTTMHHGIAMECIRAGKDILIEKPISATIEEADEIIAESQKRGVIVQVGHLERFNPAVLAIYPLITHPVFFEAERLSPFLGRGIDVDITLDLMIHDIDIILAIISHSGVTPNVIDIKASAARVLTEKIDEARAWFEFENGAQALLTASRLSFEKSRKLKIFQDDAFLLVDYQNMEIKRFSKVGGNIAAESIHVEKHEPLKEELKDFIACITDRRRPLVSASDGRNALRIAMEIGKRIPIVNKKKGKTPKK